jgi:hypothetical protein
MRKLIRNDYTFINRLEKIRHKYIAQNKEYSLSTQLGTQGYRMSIHTYEWIEDIKEDFRLAVLQKLNEAVIGRKNMNVFLVSRRKEIY